MATICPTFARRVLELTRLLELIRRLTPERRVRGVRIWRLQERARRRSVARAARLRMQRTSRSSAPEAYARHIATELGFSGGSKECKFYDYPSLCWTGKDGTALYRDGGERDTEGRYVTYLVNETIKDQDAE